MITNDVIDYVRFDSVIILDTDYAGDIYMERLFPLYVEPVVYTLEGKYPIHPLLRKKIESQLSTNSELKCILFGANAEKLKTATSKKLAMAPLLMHDLTMYFWQKPVFDFYEQSIIEIIKSFCFKIDLDRLVAYDKSFDFYKQSTIKWYHDLIRSN